METSSKKCNLSHFFKETKTEKLHSVFTRGKFSRYQRNPQKYKKIYFIINTANLCTISKSVYDFTLRHSLASRVFPNTTISVVCTEFPVGSKSHFSQWNINFSQLISHKYLLLKIQGN